MSPREQAIRDGAIVPGTGVYLGFTVACPVPEGEAPRVLRLTPRERAEYEAAARAGRGRTSA